MQTIAMHQQQNRIEEWTSKRQTSEDEWASDKWAGKAKKWKKIVWWPMPTWSASTWAASKKDDHEDVTMLEGAHAHRYTCQINTLPQGNHCLFALFNVCSRFFISFFVPCRLCFFLPPCSLPAFLLQYFILFFFFNFIASCTISSCSPVPISSLSPLTHIHTYTLHFPGIVLSEYFPNLPFASSPSPLPYFLLLPPPTTIHPNIVLSITHPKSILLQGTPNVAS